MSLGQSSLQQFTTQEEDEEDAPDGQRGAALASWEPQADDECRGCGKKWTLQYRRVKGDNDNVLHHCPECPGFCQTDMLNGAGADPNFGVEQNHPERIEGQWR